MSNQDRYAALIQEGRLTPAEAKELVRAFPEPKPQDENVIRIVGNFELEDNEDKLLRSGYRLRHTSAKVYEFRRKIDNSVQRFVVDPWLS